MKGLDYTTPTTTDRAKALKVAGYGFVCRYLVPVSMAWKRLTKDEAVILTNVGLQIVSVYEEGAQNAKKGAAQGTIDGKEAYAETQTVGQPKGSTVYFAVDYDAPVTDYPVILAYLQAAQAQLPGYEVGVYGSYAVCEAMAAKGIKHCWQTYAWSGGKKSAHANVYQYSNGVTINGVSSDLDESYGGEGFWNLTPPAPDYKALYADLKTKYDALVSAHAASESKYNAIMAENNTVRSNLTALKQTLIKLGNS